MTFITRKSKRKSGYIEIAEEPIVHGAHNLSLTHMRMRHRLFDREHLRVWHSVFLETLIDLLVAGHRVKPTLNQSFQLLDIRHPLGVVAKARVFRQVRLSHRAAHVPELMLG